MGTSKAAEAARVIPESSTTEDEDGKEEIRMPTPPIDWAFNDLLAHIANEMSKEDLEEAKSRFKGDDALRRRLLSEIETPLHLFDSLQKLTFLDRNNLLYLQAMLYKIGRMDLYDMAIDYAQNVGDTIYFSSPPEEPANGYRYIQFHIEGKDFTKVKRSSLEAIRMTAARLMIVPPEFVIIAGIEPSSSLLITFMVPERFMKYFEAALDKQPVIKELTHLGIDIVRIAEKVINIHGIEGVDIKATEEQTSLKTVYDQLQNTRQRLEDRDVECLQLKKKLEDKCIQLNDVDIQMKSILVKMLFESFMNQKVPRLSKQSAFVFFKHALTLVRHRNYDKDIISLLLDAHSVVLSERVQNSQEIQIKLLMFENQRLRDSLFQFQIAYTRLQLLSVLDDKGFQRRFLENIKSILLGQGIEVTKTVQFHPLIYQSLRVIGELLRPEDRKILLSAYTWPEEDGLTKHLYREQNDILAVIVAKEAVKTNRNIDTETFILQKLSDIKREDLKIIFNQMLSTYKTGFSYVNPSATQTAQNPAHASAQPPKSSKHHGKSGKQQQNKPTLEKTATDQLSEVLKRVTNIEEMIQQSQTASKASSFGADLLSPQFKPDPRGLFERYWTSEPKAYI